MIADLECWFADRLFKLAGLCLHYRRKLEWDASGRYLSRKLKPYQRASR